MFDLENYPGVMELSREETDPTSEPIIIDRGLVLGNDIVTTAQVLMSSLDFTDAPDTVFL